jgi:hypothetical protein
VSGLDVAFVARAMAMHKRGEEVDPVFDLNDDGLINAADIVIAAHQIGDEC